MANTNNNKKIINSFEKGINSDMSLENQPKGTYRHALNMVTETEEGDLFSLSSEESNKISTALPNKILLGQVYMAKDEVAILSTNSSETLSFIGIFNLASETYIEYVSFDLGFTKTNQFDIVYRLRKGCERTIYFTDNYIRPMRFNFDNVDNFKVDGAFSKDKFYLQKSYNDIPMFRRLEVIEGGKLLPGGYVFGIQYIDEDLNPTNIANVSNKIKIFASKLSNNYVDIIGSASLQTDTYIPKETSKAIKIDLFNLDRNYRFYRVVIVKYTNGSGEVSAVTYTDKISTSTTSYTYDGLDFAKSSLEEVQQDNFIFYKVKNIIQLEEQLILSNLAGNPDNLCSYQKYASKIKSRVVLKKQILSILSPGSPKNPSVDLFSVGYMPGEIYSFAIQYLFKDGTRSPGYHIPGIPEEGIDDTLDYNNFTDQPFRNMSLDNELESFFYDKRDTCSDYWGVDGWGNVLEGSKVRHHRFPSRIEAKTGFVFNTTEDEEAPEQILSYIVQATFQARKQDPEDGSGCDVNYAVNVTYKANGVNMSKTVILETGGLCTFFLSKKIDLGPIGPITDLEVLIDEVTPGESGITVTKGVPQLQNPDLGSFEKNTKGAYIFGIEFSNIDVPVGLPDNPVIGYEIIRQERTNNHKTILDTAVLTPILKNQNFSSAGHIFPVYGFFTAPSGSFWDGIYMINILNYLNSNPDKINENFRGMISPQFLFTQQELANFKIKHIGNYVKNLTAYAGALYEDVQPGTSYDSDANSSSEKDLDGFSLNILNRINTVTHESITPVIYEPKNSYYLDAVSSFITESNDKEIFNVSSDNRTCILEFNDTSKPAKDLNKLPYVILFRDLANPYGDYLTARFYKQQLNPTLFSSGGSDKISIYGGDSYIAPLTYSNSFFINIHPRKRGTKSGFWDIVAGALLIIVSVVATVLTFGAAAPVAAVGIQFGLSLVSSGLKLDKLVRAYSDLWDKGLKETVIDNDVFLRFNLPNPGDDEIQWMSDTVEDFWFESNININLRTDLKELGVSYIKPLRHIEGDFINKYFSEKITILDPNQGSGRLYKGFSTAEYYNLNLDYESINDSKISYLIPYEYSCCSNCREVFPHRVHSSLKSFSEEFTDNFLKFLPNDYKDISGETGPINNMFISNNRLYLHTSEALWMQPASYQERVTNEIVSFIGTGSLFETPAQRVIDDSTGNSVGLYHKWGAVQCKHGYFFPSASQNKVYMYNGKIEDLSLKGVSSWFKANLVNPYDNPSNKLVGGFLAGYDPKKERILLTNNNSELPWTLSYCLKTNSWRSFHSYIPSMYISGPNKLFTWNSLSESIWKHNILGTYQRFYNTRYDSELEYVSLENPLMSKITTSLGVSTVAKKYNTTTKTYVDVDTVSYSKVLLYNSKQTTGVLTLDYKNNTTRAFFKQSVEDLDKTKIKIGRVDKDWSINGFKDYVIDYTKPMFVAGNNSLEINKVVNSAIIDYNKNWSTLQSFKDKYLSVKYVFNNFEDLKLTTKYTTEDYEISLR